MPTMSVAHWLLIHFRNSSGAEPAPSVPQFSARVLACASALSSPTVPTAS
jgi:hypothetical protein